MLPEQGTLLVMKAAVMTHRDSEHFHTVCH